MEVNECVFACLKVLMGLREMSFEDLCHFLDVVGDFLREILAHEFREEIARALNDFLEVLPGQ